VQSESIEQTMRSILFQILTLLSDGLLGPCTHITLQRTILTKFRSTRERFLRSPMPQANGGSARLQQDTAEVSLTPSDITVVARQLLMTGLFSRSFELLAIALRSTIRLRIAAT